MHADALLRGSAAQEYIVDDDPRSGPRHRGDAGHPGSLHLAEAIADRDLALLPERDAGTSVRQRRRQRVNEVVDADADPWLG
jgi:hypothetical protein